MSAIRFNGSSSWRVYGLMLAAIATLTFPAPLTADANFRALVYNNGCGPVAAPVQLISVIPGTTAGVSAFASAGTICEGENITFTANPSGLATSPSFQWFLNGSPVAVGNTYNTTALADGDSVYVEMTTGGSCGTGVYLSNVIYPTVNATPSVSITNTIVGNCENDSLQFVAVVDTPATVTWFVNGVNTGISGDTLYNDFFNDGDDVTAIAVTALGCTSNVSNTIPVNLDPVGTVNIVVSASDICQGEQIQFVATPVNSGASPTYAWQVDTGSGFNNVLIGSAPTFTTSNAQDGWVYRVSLTTTSGCTGTGAVSNPIAITVGEYPTVAISASADTICDGSNVIYTATPLTNAGSSPTYTFRVNGVVEQSGASNTFATNTLSTGDNVSVAITSTDGCTGPVSIATAPPIVVIPNPIAELQVTANPSCVADTIIAVASSVNGVIPGAIYDFIYNGSSVLASTTPSLELPSTAVPVVNDGDNIRVVITNTLGTYACSDASSSSSPITLNRNPNPTISITASSTTICEGDPITFTANTSNSGANPDFFWLVNGTTVQTGGATFTSSTLTDQDTVQAYLSAPVICAGVSVPSNEVIVNVNPTPTVVANAAPSTTICNGETVTFTATPTDAGASPTYVWRLNGAVVGGGPSYVSSTLNGGDNITVTVTSTAGCSGPSSVSAPLTMTVNPQPTIALNAAPGSTICDGQTVNMTTSPILPGATYEWFLNGNPLAGVTGGGYTTDTLKDGDIVGVQATAASGCVSNLDDLTFTVAPAPTVSITSSTTTACTGQSISFTATPGGGATSPTIDWYVNGALVLSGAYTYNTTALNDGDTVQAEITSNSGCVGATALSNKIGVTILPDPTVTITAAPGLTICDGETITFTANPTDAGASPTYVWRLNGSVVTNGPTYVSNTLSNGDNVTVEVTSTAGCNGVASTSAPAVVNVSPTPTVTLNSSAGTSICETQTVNLTASPITPGATYDWFLNGNPLTAVSGGGYTTDSLQDGDVVGVQITSAGGCVGNIDDLTFDVAPPPTITIASSATTICNGESVSFNATPGGGATSPTIDWFVNGAFVVSGPFNYSTSTLNDGDTVQAQIFSNSGCVGATAMSNKIGISVLPDPTVTINAAPGLTVCDGEDITFTATPTNGGASPTYTWALNGTNVATGPSYVLSTPNNGDQVEVSIISTDGCSGPGSTSPASVVTVNPTPVASINQTPAGAVCAGDNISFEAAPLAAGNTYDWFVNGSPVVATGANYSSNTLNDGDVVRVQITSVDGCTGTQSEADATALIEPAPTVTITASDNTICPGETVQFTATPAPTAPSPSIEWRVNGTVVATAGFTYTTNSLADGDVIEATVTSSAGCSDAGSVSNQINMTVLPDPTVTIAAAPGLTVCDGESITFTPTPTDGGASPDYVWYLNGTLVASGGSYVLNNPNTGDQVEATITSTDGCSGAGSTSPTAVVTVNPTPVAGITQAPTGPACDGQSVSFTASPNVGGYTYDWFVNGLAVTGTGANYSTTTLNDGDVVSVQVTSGAGCTGAASEANTTVVVEPAPTVTITASATTICPGDDVFFTATPSTNSPAPSIEWAVNGTVVSTAGFTYNTNTLNDGDVVTATVTSANGCSDAGSASNALTINVATTPSVAITANPGNTVCEGENVVFTANPTNGGASPDYVWKLNGTTVGAGATYTSSFLQDGDVVTVEITGTSGCVGTTSPPFAMTVNEVPDVTLNVNPGTEVCSGATVDFTATSSYTGALDYAWSLNGTVLPGETNPGYSTNTLSNGDIVSVTLTSNPEGCTGPQSSAQAQIDVLPDPTINVLASSTNICQGETVTFSAFVTGAGTAPNVEWFVNGVFAGSGLNYTSATLNDGDQVTANVSNPTPGCTGATSTPINITVDTPVTPTLAANGGTNICEGNCIDITASLATGTYNWYVNGSLIGGLTGQNFNYCAVNGGSSYLVTAENVTANGCVSNVSSGINYQVEENPTVNITSSAQQACAGEDVTFTAFASPAAGVSYQWTVNGTAVAGATGATFITNTLTNGDVVQVEVTGPAPGNCSGPGSTSNPLSISITDAPTVSIATNPAGITEICEDEPITFTPTTTGNNLNYVWTANGVIVGNNQNLTTTDLPVGSVDVQLEVTSTACGVTVSSNTVNVEVHPNPTATITPNLVDICANESVTFQSTVVDGGTTPTLQWQIDDGTGFTDVAGATGTNYTTTALNDGELVRLVVTSTDGCPASGNGTPSNNATVSVEDQPTIATIDLTQPTGCVGEEVTLVAQGSDPNGTYEWSVNGTPVTGVSGDTFISEDLVDGDVVEAVITSSTGCSDPVVSAASVTMNITMNPIAEINILSDAAQCLTANNAVGQSFDFEASVAGLNYTWDFGAGATPSSATVQSPTGITYPDTGSRTVSLTVTDNGCDFDTTTTVEVLPAPQIGWNLATDLCITEDFTFEYTGETYGQSVVDYVWAFGPDASPAAGSTPSVDVAFADGGSKDIELTVTFGNGCSANRATTVFVDDTFSVDLGGDQVICGNDPLPTLTATTNPAFPPTDINYTWEVDGSQVLSGLAEDTYTVTGPGTYRVEVLKPSGCNAFDVIDIQVVTALEVDLGDRRTICDQGTGTSTTLNTGYPGIEHEWQLNGNVIVGETTEELEVTEPGVYTVTVNPNNQGSNCSGTDFVVVEFVDEVIVDLANGEDDIYYCASDQPVPLEAPAIPGAIYTWTTPTGLVTGSNNTYTPDVVAGNIVPWTYEVRVVTEEGCEGFDEVNVSVTPNADLSLPSLVDVCPSNVSVVLNTELYPGGFYQWTLDGELIYEGTDLNSIVADEPGIWTVNVVTNGGCPGDASTTLDAVAEPFADFDPLPEASNTIYLNTNDPVLRLSDRSQPDGDIATWTWYLITTQDDSTIIANTQDLIYEFQRQPDTVQVVLQVTTAGNGCTDFSNPLRVIIRTSDDPEIPTAFSPNEDGLNEDYVVTGFGFSEFSFMIFDRWGRKVYDKAMNADEVRWNGEDENTGEPVQESTFVFVFEGMPLDGEETVRTTGTITVIR